jgi:hypothetical protein
MLELLLVLAALTVFLLFAGITMPSRLKRDLDVPASSPTSSQVRARSIGSTKMLNGIANASVRRAMRPDTANARYLRQLRQANWFWEPGEPSMPNPKAPFWNLETLWGEKIFGALMFGGILGAVLLVLGLMLNLMGKAPMLPFMIAAVLVGGVVGLFMFTSPDGKLAGAAAKRQRELTLEMGFRIPELRADVMGGNTVQRAIRGMARKPGGPFVEELRRAVTVLDVTKDDTLAMDQLIERNEGNELLTEFANSIKMVSRQGGQIGPVLNVLADLAQQRLRLTIQSQARKNLQEMTRPIGLSNLVVTSLLIIAPALASVMGGMKF